MILICHLLLCHGTFHLKLQKIADKVKTAVKNVNQWFDQYSDYGASWYHRMSRAVRVETESSIRRKR